MKWSQEVDKACATLAESLGLNVRDRDQRCIEITAKMHQGLHNEITRKFEYRRDMSDPMGGWYEVET